ncbi:protein SULFUR DEFICIENCY-INDUCED 1-like [Miscanthus floridulus]|uniref:protein SULFUR DEFICIENCY-INDUCED 1-like n=1 Tax=Miscanthus floridulus TaxID=154761 RepID=UPI0034579C2A
MVRVGGGGSSSPPPLLLRHGHLPAGRHHLPATGRRQHLPAAWFWKAISTGDKVDSALKDMAVVMKQRGYLTKAIDAIRSLRHLCPKQSQESLDSILDLYKASGRTKEEMELLKQKLRKIYLGEAFHGKTTKRARSHGRKIHVSVKQETSRVLMRLDPRRLIGNLAWAYMQQRNFMVAEVVYRKAQMIDPDANKACNLALCLIEQTRFADAELVLVDVLAGRYQAHDQQETSFRLTQSPRKVTRIGREFPSA